MTSWHPTNLVQASLELELHEGSFPFFTHPYHFVVLVLVNSRHFRKSDKRRSGSRSPDTLESRTISRKIQALSGFLAAHSSRSFDRCLLHWRSPCSALGRFLGRLYSTYSSRTPRVPQTEPVIFLPSADGYRQISTVTRFQAHPSGLLHWLRGPCSRAAGGSLLTGAILKARSAGGVSGSLLGRSVLTPKLFDAGLLSFVSSPALLHKLQVIYKFPNFCRTRLSPDRCPSKLQKRSINHPLV